MLFVFSFAFLINITSQELIQNDSKGSFKEKFDAANLLMNDKLYEFAKDLWLEIVDDKLSNANVNYKTGFCLLNTALNKKDALHYLKHTCRVPCHYIPPRSYAWLKTIQLLRS